MHINEQSGKQKKRIEDIFRRFPFVRGERKLTIILTTRYCFIFLSRIGLAEIRTKVENNSEETKRRNATSAVFNVYGIQVKRIKKGAKNSRIERKEGRWNRKCDAREDYYTFSISYFFDCISNVTDSLYIADEM